MLNVALAKSFRYVHEPLRWDEDALPLLGNEPVIAELQDRIRHSRGGAFLITGFRGVGKTTVVRRAVEELIGTGAVPPVMLSVARPAETGQLLFAIVRRLFETLNEHGVLQRLPPDTRQRILLAYMRTSMSFKESKSDATERTGTLEFGAAKAVTNLVPKLAMSAKRTRSLATEATFLTYAESDVEYDLIRIVDLLDADPPSRRWWSWRRPPPETRLVVVLDEVDKLTALEKGLGHVEQLLAGIKNVLTMRGVHFIVVGGPDLHDRAVLDGARGTGVYDSVFGWRMYVPCCWEAPDRLLRAVVNQTLSEDEGISLEQFVRYLRFKARGMPRRLLQEFNGFVVWEGDRPFLRVGPDAFERVAFYARLEEILDALFSAGGQERLFPLAIDEDRSRLGCYYVLDWILRSEGRPFCSADILKAEDEAGLDPLLRISQAATEGTLRHLARHDLIEVVREPNAEGTMIGDVATAGLTIYKLSADIKRTLLGFGEEFESERIALDSASAPARTPWAAEETPLPLLTLGGRYDAYEVIGQGGMGTVFSGRERTTGREVAIKVLASSLFADPQALARFDREIQIATRLKHRQIVETIDVVRRPDSESALIMELIKGPTLHDHLDLQGALPSDRVAEMGVALAGALHYLDGMGIARVDLKPANIMLSPDRGPVIIDLGIARFSDADTQMTMTGGLVGTPVYISPEAISGAKVDIRADIYALGLVLYTALTGHPPWSGSIPAVLARVLAGGVEVDDLPISPEFRSVIAHATQPDRESRYQRPAELRSALEAVPEYRVTVPEPAGGSG